ncbi:MAG: recombinase family protein, partial [Clostridia bacterium]|nr:recombinase family protein [Clostridia bacterium]
GMVDNAKAGKYNGGRAIPIGIKITDDGRYKPDPEVAPWIKQAFEMYVGGHSTGDLIRFLTDKGVRTSSGGPITHNIINGMLKRPLYIGQKTTEFANKALKQTVVVGEVCEPIVDEALWNRAQEELKRRARKGGEENAKVNYELKGILFCGNCGAEMVGEKGKGHHYYKCANRKRRKADDPDRCSKEPVKKEWIESVVLKLLNTQLWSEEKIKDYLEAAKKAEKTTGENKRVAELKQIIRTHTERREKAEDAYLETGNKRWLQKSEEEQQVIDNAEEEFRTLEKLLASGTSIESLEEKLNAIRTSWDEMQRTTEGRTRIIKAFVRKIFLYDKDPDDPNKRKIKVIITPDLDSSDVEEIDAEINVGVRHQKSMFHQTGIGRTRFIIETALSFVCCADASQKSSQSFALAVFLIIKNCRRDKKIHLCRRLLTVIFLKFLHFLPNSILSIEAELTVRKNRQSF